MDADKLAEGRDNDELTDVGNPREIVDPLNERSDTDADTPELGKSKEVDGKLTDKVRKDIVDPLNEMQAKMRMTLCWADQRRSSRQTR